MNWIGTRMPIGSRTWRETLEGGPDARRSPARRLASLAPLVRRSHGELPRRGFSNAGSTRAAAGIAYLLEDRELLLGHVVEQELDEAAPLGRQHSSGAARVAELVQEVVEQLSLLAVVGAELFGALAAGRAGAAKRGREKAILQCEVLAESPQEPQAQSPKHADAFLGPLGHPEGLLVQLVE